jgi:hypothetical protein
MSKFENFEAQPSVKKSKIEKRQSSTHREKVQKKLKFKLGKRSRTQSRDQERNTKSEKSLDLTVTDTYELEEYFEFMNRKPKRKVQKPEPVNSFVERTLKLRSQLKNSGLVSDSLLDRMKDPITLSNHDIEYLEVNFDYQG